MAESKVVSFLPLKGGNYATWKLQCQMALMKENLWTTVNETEPPPAEDATAAVASKWRSRKDKALATIVLSIDPSLLYLLGEPKEPVDVWKKLKSQFQKKTWANKLVLRRKLYALRLKEGESIQGHIKKLTEICNELAAIEAPLDEEDKVVQLLASLPEAFDTLVTALEANEKVPAMETVIERLLYEERKSKIAKARVQELSIKQKRWQQESSQSGNEAEYVVTTVENSVIFRGTAMLLNVSQQVPK